MGNKQSKIFPNRKSRVKSTVSTSGVFGGQELQTLDLTGGYSQKVIVIPDESDQKSEPKEHWSHGTDFILASLGYAIGFGNLWRFPYKMHEHGGINFLIPYFFFLIILGLPLFFIELVLGQYVSYGPTKIYGAMSPLFTGLGYSMIAIVACSSIYYNVINSWCIFYFITSFQNPLPWNSTNTEEYFVSDVLRFKKGITWYNFGSLHWELVLCSLAAWLIIAVVSSKSLHQARWMLKFNTLYPFLVMTTLCIIGLSKSGGTDGVIECFTFKGWGKVLENSTLLKDAAVQVIFSLGIGIGNLANFARFNDFKNNCLRDAMMVIAGDTLASIVAGITVYAFVGFIAFDIDPHMTVDDLIKEQIQEGPTLTFSAMMSGLDIIGRDVPYLSQSLTAMFSIMLLTIGMNSMIAEIFNIKYALLDQYKPLRRYRIQLTFGLCAFFFLLSLPYCTSGGYQLFLAMDNSVIANNAIFVALLQLVLVGWVYGVKNFMDCVSKMGIELKSSTRWYFHACIRYICPFTLTMLLTIALIHNFNNYHFVEFKFYRDGKTKNYKLKEAEPLVWMVQVFTLSFIPVMAIWKIWQSRNSSRSLCRATAQWVPMDEIVTTVVF